MNSKNVVVACTNPKYHNFVHTKRKIVKAVKSKKD
jgi:hypothetical protein